MLPAALTTIVTNIEGGSLTAFTIKYEHKCITDILWLNQHISQGWSQDFSDGGLTSLTRGLKYGVQGTIDAKISEKIAFHLPTGGLACSNGGL